MIVMFELSMPGVNSWNGKWTGEGKRYLLFRSMSKIPSFWGEGYFSYRFGDGWVAGVTATSVTAAEKRRLERKSAGFCGYDWMVDSILENGRIVARRAAE